MTRLLLALLAVLAAGAIALVVVVIAKERDPVPGALRHCLDDAGAQRVVGSDGLGPMRVDLLAGTLRAAPPVQLRDGYRATALHPRDGSYLAYVVARSEQARLSPLRTIEKRPEVFPMVAWAQRGDAPALRACIMAQRP